MSADFSAVAANSPIVTIYIINRNYARFLRQAVDSALEQDYERIEVLIVDDASSDGSDEVLNGYSFHPRVKILRQKHRSGLTACCNAALRASRGEFVMRLDADDYLAPNAVSRMALTLAAHRDAVLVFPDYLEVDAAGSIIRRVQRHDFTALEALSDLPAHGACTMIRRTFLDQMGLYDEAIDRQDGLDVWLSVDSHQHVKNIGEPLFYYRQHGSNLTRDERALLEARAKVIAKHVHRRALAAPRVLGLVPVRGQVVDAHSLPLRLLGDRPLIDWTLDEALGCSGLKRVVLSSPDPEVLAHVVGRYGVKVGIHQRGPEMAGLNVSVIETIEHALTAEIALGFRYDAVMILTVECPFRTRMFMQQAIHTMQLFNTDGVVSVRRDSETFYTHDGNGLKPWRESERLRLERDDLFRGCGGLRLLRLGSGTGSADDHGSVRLRPTEKLGHVFFDQLSGFTLYTMLDWQIAESLVEKMIKGSDGLE